LDELSPIIALFLLELLKSLSLHWFQDIKAAAQSLIYIQDTCVVIEFSAVVRSREDGHQASVSHELVALFDHLMGSANQVYVVALVKLSDNVGAEDVTHSSIVVAPALDVNLGIRPK
jgi:hypothetical protein